MEAGKTALIPGVLEPDMTAGRERNQASGQAAPERRAEARKSGHRRPRTAVGGLE
jgi:hypothetical protein